MPYSGGYYKEEDDDLNDEEEEEEGGAGEIKSANDHCILLIDARTNMFEVVNDDGEVRNINMHTRSRKTRREGEKDPSFCAF